MVLPPLCAELRNMVIQPMILPMILKIADSQEKNDFEHSTLPALVPILSYASGETLLLLVKNAELIIHKVSQQDLIPHVLPFFVRAFDDSDPCIQEEVLQRTVPLLRQLDVQLVKQTMVSRVHSSALKTTVASYGREFAVEHVLPLLFPLLASQQLNVQQFAKYMLFVKDILRTIEEKLGVRVTYSGSPDVKLSATSANEMKTELLPKLTEQNSSTKSKPSWGEDWGPTVKKTGNTSLPVEASHQPERAVPILQQAPITDIPLRSITAASSQQTSPTCTPVNVEWPPSKSHSGFGVHLGVNENQNAMGTSNSSFDDLNPFANWPPRSSNSASSLVSVNAPNQSYGISGPDFPPTHLLCS
ncbi:uncharacterized protein LOC121985977 isoform X2 [Zingiber officinale]|uniref:uncharacterized protein LOC121985977 isoform X2 n=1 Tax=Zingiber officinale TaxID=94328 RepID=UPI001C4D580E|nr:uncharacterized protein LOC121985977 isoform X2 [Zingiber officinale]